jgi:hypothetical protein
MAKIFFISPVRLATEKDKEICREYVENLEKQGHEVHWPIRDTYQLDPVGIRICDTNLRKILEADEIHVWFLKTSSGIHFDLGAAYLLVRVLGYKKRIVFVNREEFSQEINMLLREGKKDYLLVLNFLDQQTKKETE